MHPKHHRTVDRVTELLEAIARDGDGLTLSELATRLEAPKSSIQGLLQGLLATGYVVEHDGTFALGPGPYVLTLIANRMPARLVSHSDLVELAEMTGETVLLAVRAGDHAIYIDEVGSHPMLDFVARSRSRRPLLTTAAGKIIMADMADHDLHRYLADLPADQQSAVADFFDQIATIRETGLAYNREASIAGVDAVGTAVRDHRGELVAALVVAGRKEAVENRLEQLGQTAQQAAQRWGQRRTGPYPA